MQEKYYPTIVYNNETISLYLFKVYAERSFLLFKKEVYSGDISKIESFTQYSKIASLLKKEFLLIEERFKEKFIDIYCMIEPKNFFSKYRTLNYEFPEQYLMENADVSKILHRLKKDEPHYNEFEIASFNPSKIHVDQKNVLELVGKYAKKLSMEGEIIYVDDQTFFAVERIAEELNRNVLDYIVSNNMLKYSNFIKNKQAIIEIESGIMNFMYKNDNSFKNFKIDFGMGHIYEKVFHKLNENYSDEDSYKVTKYLQEHPLLYAQEINFQIVPSVYINDVIELYNGIFKTYMNGIFEKLENQGINIEQFYLLSYGYDTNALVEQFNHMFQQEIKKFKVSKTGDIQHPDSKLYFAIQKYHQTRLF